MTQFMGYAIFIAVVAVVAALHVYVWRRGVRPARLPDGLRRTVLAVLAAGAALLPLAAIALLLFPRDAIGDWLWAPLYWLVPASYVMLFLATADVLKLARRAVRSLARAGTSGPATDLPDPGRRVFLARSIAGVSTAGAVAVSAGGVRSALGEFRVPEVPVRLERLPRALDGFRIALLSDVHVTPLLGEDYVRAAVERTNRLRPDLVAITGDLVDAPVSVIGRDVAPIAGLASRYGTFFVTGNHEYYTGEPEAWLRFLESLGVRVLRNERVTVGDRGPGGATFDLAGVFDWSRRHGGGAHAPRLDYAVAGRDPARELVLLAHQPGQIEGAAAVGVGLQLSGHTHAGQIWPLGPLLAAAGNPYVHGLHRHTDRTSIYVTAGTGWWGVPVRVFAPPEITLLVLTSD